MTEHAGVLRSEAGLGAGRRPSSPRSRDKAGVEPGTAAWETTNLLTLGAAPWSRPPRCAEETRGSHWREDFPERDDAHWFGHVDVALDDGRASGLRSRTTRPTAPPDGPRRPARDR